jgi:ABC-2 type transport system permease protein
MTELPRTPAELRVVARRATWALAAREMRRVLGLWTQTLPPPVITGLIFLALFGGALGSRLGAVSGVPYARFILPGLLVMTVAGQAFANASTSLFQAKNEGYIDDVLSSPLRPSEVVLAYMAGGLLRGWLSALVLAVVAAPFAGAPGNPVLLAAALVITGAVFAGLGVITGVWADSFDQHAFVANLVIAPLALLGGVFYATERLGQPWRTLTRADPLYYVVDATRHGWAGVHEASVADALLVTAVVGAAVVAFAVALVDRGWRLKP